MHCFLFFSNILYCSGTCGPTSTSSSILLMTMWLLCTDQGSFLLACRVQGGLRLLLQRKLLHPLSSRPLSVPGQMWKQLSERADRKRCTARMHRYNASSRQHENDWNWGLSSVIDCICLCQSALTDVSCVWGGTIVRGAEQTCTSSMASATTHVPKALSLMSSSCSACPKVRDAVLTLRFIPPAPMSMLRFLIALCLLKFIAKLENGRVGVSAFGSRTRRSTGGGRKHAHDKSCISQAPPVTPALTFQRSGNVQQKRSRKAGWNELRKSLVNY